MGKRAIKVFGERHSCTKYLRKLIQLNFDVEILDNTGVDILRYFPTRAFDEALSDWYIAARERRTLGWKHRAVPAYERLEEISEISMEDIGVVCLTRNPYPWLLAMHKSPYHNPNAPRSFDHFLRTSWPLVKRDGIPQKALTSPMELWNQKMASYMVGRFQLMRAEDLVCSPVTALDVLAMRFGLRSKHKVRVLYSDSLSEDKKTSDDYKEYYSRDLWIDQLSKSAIRIINERIDWSIANSLGYLQLSV